MGAQSHYIDFKRSKIHYTRSGEGKAWLFCFHGYGEEADSFAPIAARLSTQFTIVAIDMPFHGKTDWREGLLFSPQDLIEIIHRIKPESLPMHLLGYSMGGRIGLQLLQDIPAEIDRVVVVAPDGLHRNKWQWFATRTSAGNRLFAHAMQRPAWIMRVLKLASGLKLYNTSLLKFVHYYLDDATQRKVLYERWTTMRKFRPGLKRLQQIIAERKIPVKMLFGRYDKVILSRHGFHFAAGAKEWVEAMEIEAGHRLLREPYIALIAALIVG